MDHKGKFGPMDSLHPAKSHLMKSIFKEKSMNFTYILDRFIPGFEHEIEKFGRIESWVRTHQSNTKRLGIEYFLTHIGSGITI